MSGTSVWMIVGPQVHAQYRERLAAESADPPEPYDGPMDDTSYAILQTMQSPDAVQSQYKVKGSGPGAFILYSTYYESEEAAIFAVDWMEANWPGPQVIPQGAWYLDTGLQMGVSYVDPEDPSQGTTGDPVYPIPSDAYEIMPDTVVYDEDGNEISRTPATSNADLRNVNILSGQKPREFLITPITQEEILMLTAQTIPSSGGLTGFKKNVAGAIDIPNIVGVPVEEISSGNIAGGLFIFNLELLGTTLKKDSFYSVRIADETELFTMNSSFDQSAQSWVWAGTNFDFDTDTNYQLVFRS